MIKPILAATAIAVTALASYADPVHSSTESTDTIVALSEVSITAIKHTAPDLPEAAASTVVGADQIERLNIVTMKGVSEVAPNFYTPDYGSRMTSSVYVRGIGARIDQPAVGLNIDNVPYVNKDNYDFDLVDIERIEMLRGPQSTLYGRNTMGGLINIYTLSPMRYQGFRAMAEYASANSAKAALSYYTLLQPGLGMGFTGYVTHTDGFFRNLHNGKKVDKENQLSLRWKTSWRPAAGMTVDNVMSFGLTRQGGYPYEYLETGEINYNDTCFYRRNAFTDGLTVNWHTGSITLSSITSVQHINDNMTLDQDFLPLDYFTLTQKRREWALTQDFVVKGSKGPYSWLGGLFAMYKHTRMDAPVTFKDYGIEQLVLSHRNEFNPDYPIAWQDESFVLGSEFTTPVTAIALYHQSTYRTGQWVLSAGLRLDLEHSRLNYRSTANTGFTIYNMTSSTTEVFDHVPVDIDDRGNLHKTFIELLPKITASYMLPGTGGSNIYGSVARGYKAGGFNTQMFSDVLQQRIMGLLGLAERYNVDDIVSYRPESSWNYEIGAHLSTNDHRLSGEIALFWIECRDQQLTMFPDGVTTGRIMANAGRTRSVGAEVSVKYAPDDRWTINASYGHTSAKFRKYADGINDYAGKYIPYAPRNTVFAGVNYRLPVKSQWLDAIAFNANCRGIGSIEWNEANTQRQPFYALAGASVRLVHSRYSLDLWAENITDTDYDVFYFVSISNAFAQRGKPRRCGITMRMNF